MIRFLIVFAFFVLAAAPFARAEDPPPALPAPIQNLVDEGAQIRYLGKDHGLDAWLTLKNGVEQYFYVMPDQKSFVMGLLFDDKGKLVTVQQVDRLRASGDKLLESLASSPVDEQAAEKKDGFDLKSPSEQLYSDIEASNWIPLGDIKAPVVYSFIDPQCPHCHSFIDELLKVKAFETGKIQLRLIPVGLKDETRAQAAYLIATPDPQAVWMRHMAGDKDALPARAEINQQGVQRNLAIMQSWKFDVTPMVVYRAKDGSVKIVRGKPQDVAALLADIGQ